MHIVPFRNTTNTEPDPIAVLRTCGLFATNNTDSIIIRISAKLFDFSPVCVRFQLLPRPYRARYCDDCCHPLPNLMAITREWPSLARHPFPIQPTSHSLLAGPPWTPINQSQFQYGCRETFAETIQSDRGQGYFWQSCFCGSQFRPGGHNCSSSLSLHYLHVSNHHLHTPSSIVWGCWCGAALGSDISLGKSQSDDIRTTHIRGGETEEHTHLVDQLSLCKP